MDGFGEPDGNSRFAFALVIGLAIRSKPHGQVIPWTKQRSGPGTPMLPDIFFATTRAVMSALPPAA